MNAKAEPTTGIIFNSKVKRAILPYNIMTLRLLLLSKLPPVLFCSNWAIFAYNLELNTRHTRLSG